MEILQIALHITVQLFLWGFPNLALLAIVSQKHHNPYDRRFCPHQLSLVEMSWKELPNSNLWQVKGFAGTR